MALFGGIGKALGLGTPGGRGFITGLAGSLSEKIDADLAKTEENVSRLAELRASRAERDDATNRAAKAASKLELQDMVSQLGNDPDAAQSLIDQFGYSQAKTYAPLVAKTSMNTGKSPASIIGLTTRKGSSVTLDQLINHVTPIVDTSSSVGGTRGSVAVGFGKMFGGDEAAQKRYESQSDALIDAGGFRTPDEVLDTMPPALQNNLKPYVLGKLPDALKEAQRLTEISINLKAEGKEEEAAALKIEANTLTLISQMTKSKDDKLTVGEQNSYGKLLGTKLGSRYGIDGILGDDGLLVDKDLSQQIRSEYISLEAGLKNKIATYVSASVSKGASKSDAYAFADAQVSKAIANNIGIELIVPEDGPPRFELLDTPLSTILMNKDGTPPPASNEPNLGATVPPEATATEQTPITTGDSAVDALTLDYTNATTDAQREAIIEKLVRMGKRQVAQKLQGK